MYVVVGTGTCAHIHMYMYIYHKHMHAYMLIHVYSEISENGLPLLQKPPQCGPEVAIPNYSL